MGHIIFPVTVGSIPGTQLDVGKATRSNVWTTVVAFFQCHGRTSSHLVSVLLTLFAKGQSIHLFRWTSFQFILNVQPCLFGYILGWWNEASSASQQSKMLTATVAAPNYLSNSPSTCPVHPLRTLASWTPWCPTVANIGAVQHSQKTRLTWWQECKQSTHLGHTVDQMPCNNNPSTYYSSSVLHRTPWGT